MSRSSRRKAGSGNLVTRIAMLVGLLFAIAGCYSVEALPEDPKRTGIYAIMYNRFTGTSWALGHRAMWYRIETE